MMMDASTERTLGTMPQRRIYLDHAATTPVRPEVREAMLPWLGDRDYNPSSLHAEGRRARAGLDEARERAAALLGVRAKEIVFTGSGSEADNLAVIGIARALCDRGRHVVVSAIEHHAVLHALDALREEGFEGTLVAPNDRGVVEPDRFAAALRADTILASVMLANNEIGTIQPVAELARIARARGVLFHTDAVQAALALPLDQTVREVDALSLAAHKLGGPKGIGLLWVRAGTPIVPLVRGGGQEYGRRAGTENLAGIVGFVRALELSVAERDDFVEHVGRLRALLEGEIVRRAPGAHVNGAGSARVPHIASLGFDGVRPDELLVRLDLDGLAVSSGSACTSGVPEPSHVLAALGGAAAHRAPIRCSLGRTTTEEEIARAVEVIAAAVADLRERDVALR